MIQALYLFHNSKPPGQLASDSDGYPRPVDISVAYLHESTCTSTIAESATKHQQTVFPQAG